MRHRHNIELHLAALSRPPACSTPGCKSILPAAGQQASQTCTESVQRTFRAPLLCSADLLTCPAPPCLGPPASGSISQLSLFYDYDSPNNGGGWAGWQGHVFDTLSFACLIALRWRWVGWQGHLIHTLPFMCVTALCWQWMGKQARLPSVCRRLIALVVKRGGKCCGARQRWEAVHLLLRRFKSVGCVRLHEL